MKEHIRPEFFSCLFLCVTSMINLIVCSYLSLQLCCLSYIHLYSSSFTGIYYYKVTCWPALRWRDSSVVRALHRYPRGHGFEFRSDLIFFQALISQRLRKKLHYFPSNGSENAGNGILEAHILNFFSRGSMPPNLPRGSHLRRSWARLCWAENRLLLVVRAGISQTGILKT